ncbi:hypothetical protein D9M69_324820 [compost metagenome]
MNTAPLTMRRARRLALATSALHSAPDRPNSLSLASSMACSASRATISEATGPKISWRNEVIPGFTSARMVGA